MSRWLLVGALMLTPTIARAADLDGPAFADSGQDSREVVRVHRRGGLPLVPPVVVPPTVTVVSPLSVGGAYVAVPGLNGPYGPPAYPLLPFAFGYGY